MFVRSINARFPIFYAKDGDASGGGGDGGEGDGKGGDPGDTKPTTKEVNDDGQGKGGDTGKTYTQADVDALDKKFQKRYGTAGAKALLDELGVEDTDALKALVEADKKRADDELSDNQKATKAAQEEKEAAAKERNDLKLERLSLQLERQLLRPGADPAEQPGLNPERIKAAMAIALPHALASEDEDVDEIIAEAVAHTRAELPEVFGSEAPGGGKPPGTPGTPNRPANQRKTNHSEGKDGAAAMAEWRKKNAGRQQPLPGATSPN